MWKVEIWEYERGWGSRIDEIESFETYDEAKAFHSEYNSYNDQETVPDWYMAANPPVFVGG